MPRDLTNGELSIKLENIGKTLTEIKVQVQMTNGRVTRLEAYKYATIGALIILNLIVVPLMLQYLGKLIP